LYGSGKQVQWRAGVGYGMTSVRNQAASGRASYRLDRIGTSFKSRFVFKACRHRLNLRDSSNYVQRGSDFGKIPATQILFARA
jgi:hypothetical protein